MRKIDLNCDMGESTRIHDYDIRKDLAMLDHVSSINIACGMHAGDPYTMHVLVEAALEKGVAIGVHPSFADIENFGRKPIILSPSQVYDLVVYQAGALFAFLHIYGARLHHLKPHGALYNMAAKDRALADAIALAVMEFDKELILYGLSGSELIKAADGHGLRSCNEVFADRTYQHDGSLTPRTEQHAIIENISSCIDQVLQMVNDDSVKTTSGVVIPIAAETICLHGDHPKALEFAKALTEQLITRNVLIQQP